MSDEIIQPPENDQKTEQTSSLADLRNRKTAVIMAVVVALAGLAFLVLLFVLFNPATDTQKLRDIFIIIMGFETLIVGLALIILIIQLARLINLLQNEIKPILNSTNNTVNTLRGTTEFLSDNIVEPVIKLNEYFAAFKEMFRLIGFSGKRK